MLLAICNHNLLAISYLKGVKGLALKMSFDDITVNNFLSLITQTVFVKENG